MTMRGGPKQSLTYQNPFIGIPDKESLIVGNPSPYKQLIQGQIPIHVPCSFPFLESGIPNAGYCVGNWVIRFDSNCP